MAESYQVSCSMKFEDVGYRNMILSYLAAKFHRAFTIKGDSLTPDRLSYAAKEIQANGEYKLQCRLRFPDTKTRDDLVILLTASKTLLVKDSTGFIEQHTCLHDASGTAEAACVDQVLDSWGGAEK